MWNAATAVYDSLLAIGVSCCREKWCCGRRDFWCLPRIWRQDSHDSKIFRSEDKFHLKQRGSPHRGVSLFPRAYRNNDVRACWNSGFRIQYDVRNYWNGPRRWWLMSTMKVSLVGTHIATVESAQKNSQRWRNRRGSISFLLQLLAIQLQTTTTWPLHLSNVLDDSCFCCM